MDRKGLPAKQRKYRSAQRYRRNHNDQRQRISSSKCILFSGVSKLYVLPIATCFKLVYGLAGSSGGFITLSIGVLKSLRRSFVILPCSSVDGLCSGIWLLCVECRRSMDMGQISRSLSRSENHTEKSARILNELWKTDTLKRYTVNCASRQSISSPVRRPFKVGGRFHHRQNPSQVRSDWSTWKLQVHA